MKKRRITIQHQLDKTDHTFLVVNPDKLTQKEVEFIKLEMGVSVLLVNGKLYK